MQSLWIGASGMTAGQRQLDVSAHNLANVNTIAFRRQRAIFRDDQSPWLQRPAWPTAAGLPESGTGVRHAATLTDHHVGAIEPSDRPSDLALTGPGFFVVETPDGERLYTRNGAFMVDAEGRLVNDQGHFLLDDDGDPIDLPRGATLRVQQDGSVWAEFADGNRRRIADLAVATFINPAGLMPRGGSAFAATAASGPADLGRPGRAGRGLVRQGYLERSNVDLAAEMVTMLLAQRAFSFNARVVQTSDEMFALANHLPS